jgi:hypothetical protein
MSTYSNTYWYIHKNTETNYHISKLTNAWRNMHMNAKAKQSILLYSLPGKNMQKSKHVQRRHTYTFKSIHLHPYKNNNTHSYTNVYIYTHTCKYTYIYAYLLLVCALTMITKKIEFDFQKHHIHDYFLHLTSVWSYLSNSEEMLFRVLKI